MATNNIRVLNPSGVSDVVESALSTRPEDLFGKRMVILWNLKPNGDILLARLQDRLNTSYGLKSVVWKHRPHGAATEVGTLKELVSSCDVVINALAD